MTLIEIVLVLALVAILSVIALPKLSSGDRIRSAVRRLTVITKQTQTASRLSGSIYRLVFDMPEKDKPSTYWVEQATQKEIKLSLSNEEDSNAKEGENTSETGFGRDSKITKKPEQLPSGFEFEDIEFPDGKTINSGKAYIYFFPQGLVTKSIIHLTNKKDIHWSIIINPLTGQGSVVTEYKTLKDLE